MIHVVTMTVSYKQEQLKAVKQMLPRGVESLV